MSWSDSNDDSDVFYCSILESQHPIPQGFTNTFVNPAVCIHKYWDWSDSISSLLDQISAKDYKNNTNDLDMNCSFGTNWNPNPSPAELRPFHSTLMSASFTTPHKPSPPFMSLLITLHLPHLQMSSLLIIESGQLSEIKWANTTLLISLTCIFLCRRSSNPK